jgi:hypothetical protein
VSPVNTESQIYKGEKLLELLPKYRDTEVKPPDGEHSTYMVDGVEHERVTSILDVISKPALVPWAAGIAADSFAESLTALLQVRSLSVNDLPGLRDMAAKAHDATRDNAASFGTSAHHAIEEYITSGVVPTDLGLVPILNAFEAWRTKEDLTIEYTERIVWNPEYKYGGTIDAVAYRDGKPIVIDFKTGSSIYKEAGLQVAAYAYGLRSTTGVPIDEAWVVNIPRKQPEKGTGFTTRKIPQPILGQNFTTFLAVLDVYKGMKRPVWVTRVTKKQEAEEQEA